jgi:DNA-binding transcriptional LysR family regulator
MNFQHYEALYWIDRLGSFHAAARHLGTSQPAISGRIRDLELELGIMLFDRSQRKVRPTPKGHELLQFASQLMDIAEEIRRRAGAREVVAGHVRMGVTGMAALTWGRTLVERMSVSHADVRIELLVETSEILSEQIEEGNLDVAVLAGPISSTKVGSESLGRVPLSWIASPKLGIPSRPIAAAELAAWPIISDRPGTYLHSAAMAWFRSDGVEPRLHHACSSLPNRVQLAAQGLGVAFAARSAASRELQQGTLQLLATLRPTPEIEYFMAIPLYGSTSAARIVAETAKLLIAQKPDLESYYSAAERMIQWSTD